MGKSSKWFRCFLGLKKHDPSSPSNQNPKPTKKKKWSFVKFCREKDSNFVKEPSNYGRVVSNSRAIAVVEATAVVKRSGVSASSRENWAAVVIQSHFRAYLSRRALRGLKGLVKLQALVRGHIVRQQTVVYLRQMQAISRTQSRARVERSRSPHSRTKSVQFLHVDSTTPEKFEHVIRARSLKNDETSMLKSRGDLRGLKGLVKLQAPVRGHIVRQKSAVFLWQLKAAARAKSRARAVRSQVTGSPHSATKSVQFLHADPTTLEKFEHVIRTRSLKHDETSMLQSRRALQGLKGQVKLQAPMRGHIVRQESAIFLRQLQAVARAKSRSHAGRSQITGSPHSSTQSAQFLHVDTTTPEKFEHVIRAWSLKHEETSILKSRRGLRALKGLVKFQALVRGHIVRQQTTVFPRQMQAIARAQSRTHAGWSQVSGCPHSNTKSVQFLHAHPTTPEKFEHVICTRSLKHDETSMLQSRRALQGLNGLVKLQAPVRGHIVRQQTAVYLRQMQAIARAQSRTHAGRSRISGSTLSSAKQVQFLYADPPTLEKFEHVIRVRSLKHDETSMIKSRRALRGLNGLVKLQALVRGQIVRQQTTVYLRQMQAIARAQSRARAGRSQVSGSPHSSTKSVQFLHADHSTPEKFEHVIHARSLKHDETSMLQSRRALQGLKGLVKLQALVRGHIVRQESAVFLRQLQAVERVQSRARARKYQVIGPPHSNTKSVQFLHVDPTTLEKFENVIRIKSLKQDETSMLKSRRALRGLNGLVKLQALVRGQIVRRQTAVYLRQMQAIARAQLRARAGRSQVSGSPYLSTKSVQFLHADPTTSEKFEHIIRARSLKHDETFMLQSRRALRALKGLVKLQALVRGHIVRQESIVFLRQLKAVARVQSRACVGRSLVLGSPHSSTKPVQFFRADPTTPQKFEHVICARILKNDETSMLQSRGALRGLMGPVKLQAPVRGHIVRQESAVFLWQLQAVARAMSRAHAGWSQVIGYPHSSTQSVQLLHVDLTTPEKFEHVIRARSLKYDKTFMLKTKNELGP